MSTFLICFTYRSFVCLFVFVYFFVVVLCIFVVVVCLFVFCFCFLFFVVVLLLLLFGFCCLFMFFHENVCRRYKRWIGLSSVFKYARNRKQKNQNHTSAIKNIKNNTMFCSDVSQSSSHQILISWFWTDTNSLFKDRYYCDFRIKSNKNNNNDNKTSVILNRSASNSLNSVRFFLRFLKRFS